MIDRDEDLEAAARAAHDAYEESQDVVALQVPAPRETVRRSFASVEALCLTEERKRDLRLQLLADLPAGVWLGGAA